MFKHILIPTDGSELSDKAVKHGVALAKVLGAKLVGLHVVPEPVALYSTEVAWADERILDQLREAAAAEGNKYLDAVQAAAESSGVKFDRVLVEGGQVWKGIIETAKNKGCDLIVMAAHGRRGVAALLIGSETNQGLDAFPDPGPRIPLKGEGAGGSAGGSVDCPIRERDDAGIPAVVPTPLLSAGVRLVHSPLKRSGRIRRTMYRAGHADRRRIGVLSPHGG